MGNYQPVADLKAERFERFRTLSMDVPPINKRSIIWWSVWILLRRRRSGMFGPTCRDVFLGWLANT